MKTSQSSLFILTAGIALILCAVIFFLPESADDPLLSTSEGAAKAGNPVVSTEPEPASPRLAPATKADSGTEASRSKAKEEPLTSISLAQAHLALQIFDDEGNPLEGALVQLAKAPDRGGYSYYGSIGERLIRNPELLLAQANTGADGTALIAGLAQHSEYEVLITANGKASVEIEFETEDLGKPIAIGPVPLGPSAAVEIEILEADGTPVAGMEVTVYADPIPERYSKDFPPIEEQSALTGADGVAVLNQLPQIPDFGYGFGGAAISGQPKFEPVGKPNEEGGRLKIILPNSKWATGKVIDSNGQPVANAQISMQRLSKWYGEDEPTVELLRLQGPSGLWGSHTELSMYKSEILSDENGTFKAKIPEKSMITPKGPDVPDMVSAIVLIGEDFGQCGNWFLFDEEIVIEVPAFYSVRGRVIAADGKLVVDAQVQFHERIGPGEEPKTRDDADYSMRFDSDPTPCGEVGQFTKNLLAGTYWLEVHVPGGRHKFAGPYVVDGELGIGDISLQPGRTVRLLAKAQDPSRPITELEASRSTTPKEREEGKSGNSFFGGGGDREPNTPWGDRDYAWNQTRAKGVVEQATAVWRNQSNGDWRYLLKAPGFVPAIVDLQLDDATGDQELEVPMEATGQVRIQVSLRDGQPAKGVKIQLRPEDDKPAHPMFEKLRKTSGWYRDLFVEEIADDKGVVFFKDVFPGVYQIISLEMKEEDSFFAPPPDIDRPTLATFSVKSGETTKVIASLAAMAELRIWVSRNGQLLPDAEVFVVTKSASSRGLLRVLDPEPSGITGEDGSALITSLVPDKTHIVGARVPDGTRLYGVQNPWTMQEIEITAGNQEATIELASGGVRLRIETDTDHKQGRLSLLNDGLKVEEADVNADRKQALMEWQQFRANTEPYQRLSYSLSTAGCRASVDTSTEIVNIPSGTYRVLAEFGPDENQAFAVSEAFEVTDSVVDIGTLKLIPFTQCKIEITNLPSSTEEIRMIGLYCFRPGENRATDSASFFRPGRPVKLMLPPGKFELALFQGAIEVGRSPEFQVEAGADVNFTWTASDVKFAPED